MKTFLVYLRIMIEPVKSFIYFADNSKIQLVCKIVNQKMIEHGFSQNSGIFQKKFFVLSYLLTGCLWYNDFINSL